jgi:hypothetical protein
VSAISNNQTFCLPIGTDKLIYSSCDKLDWVNNKFIVASANPLVSAQFGVTNTTSGYEFWFFDPNGSYSYRRFRSHATSDGFGTGAYPRLPLQGERLDQHPEHPAPAQQRAAERACSRS